jgi:hypothetical protein
MAFARLTIAALALCILSGCATRYTQFGAAPQRPVHEPLKVAEILKDPDQWNGQYVRVSGTVRDLCAHAGCWMEIADTPDGKPLWVQFTYDTSTQRVPVEAKGHRAVVEGKLVVTEVSEAQRRHYAEDQGASADEIAKIKGTEKRVQLEAPYAGIEGVQPAAPQACEHS